MDSERRAEIRRYAKTLEDADSAELRAAGQALAILVSENEYLAQRLARLERDDPGGGGPGPAGSTRDSPAVRSVLLPAEVYRQQRRMQRRPFPWRRVATGTTLAAVLIVGAGFTTEAVQPHIETGGLDDRAVVGAAGASRLVVWARTDTGSKPTWRLDGRKVKPEHVGDRYVVRPGRLLEGGHELEVSVGSGWFRSATRRIAFEIDTQAPELELAAPAVHTRGGGEPVVVEGTVEPGATALYRGRTVPIDGEGRFRIELATPPAEGALVLELADRAGNRSRWSVPVTVIPRHPERPVRAVHVTARAWADDRLREGVLDLVRTNRINAVELDLKDEGGIVGWNADVPYARKIGAVEEIFDLEAAVRQLHEMGARVIGRLVCFRDPIHSQAAWSAGRRAEVVQSPDGRPYALYGGFTNFADPTVRAYNIDIAVAAAELGVDEILYDYVRRPDGPIAAMRFPGLRGRPRGAVTGFLRQSRATLAGTGVLVGASVFGVSATRPDEVAQHIPSMARALDYVAPMLYPSHWGRGEYGVADPNGSPYAIVRRSLVDFVRQTQGTGARVVPWLQDFSYGRTYGPAEVAAQIRAVHDSDLQEFLLWDAGVTYTRAALEPTAERPNLGLTTSPPPGTLRGPERLPDPTRPGSS
jgi:hypothetical protein